MTVVQESASGQDRFVSVLEQLRAAIGEEHEVLLRELLGALNLAVAEAYGDSERETLESLVIGVRMRGCAPEFSEWYETHKAEDVELMTPDEFVGQQLRDANRRKVAS